MSPSYAYHLERTRMRKRAKAMEPFLPTIRALKQRLAEIDREIEETRTAIERLESLPGGHHGE